MSVVFAVKGLEPPVQAAYTCIEFSNAPPRKQAYGNSQVVCVVERKKHKSMKSAFRATPIPVSLSTVLALVGCSAGSEVPQGRCDPVATRALVGQPKPSDEDAEQRTGATIVRQIAPGQAVTHDLRDTRVTLETDPTSGRVVAATCG